MSPCRRVIGVLSGLGALAAAVAPLSKVTLPEGPVQKATHKPRSSSKKVAFNKYLYCKITIDKSVLQTRRLLLGQTFFFVPGHVLFQACDISNILLIMYSLDKKRDNILLVSSVFPYWEVEVVRNYYIMQGNIYYKVDLLILLPYPCSG